MKKTLLSFLAGALLLTANAQERNFWTPVEEPAGDLFAARYRPASYRIFRLNEAGLSTDLSATPSERRMSITSSGSILLLPDADGRIQRFRIVEAPVMEDGLSARYPGIHSYAGQGIDDPSASVRFDISPEGFHAMILTPGRPAVFIDPVDRQGKLYTVFAKTGAAANSEAFQCLTAERANLPSATQPVNRNADDARLRTYRLALASTGEYSTYFLNGS